MPERGRVPKLRRLDVPPRGVLLLQDSRANESVYTDESFSARDSILSCDELSTVQSSDRSISVPHGDESNAGSSRMQWGTVSIYWSESRSVAPGLWAKLPTGISDENESHGILCERRKDFLISFSTLDSFTENFARPSDRP